MGAKIQMKYIEEIFDNIELEKFQRDGDCIYDSIRSFLLAATPEECVRQKTIVYLQQQLGIPVNRIFVEESMAHTKKGARGRADIVVYRDDECTDVLMIIECRPLTLTYWVMRCLSRLQDIEKYLTQSILCLLTV